MRKCDALAAAAFVLLAAVMTWPLVLRLDRAVADPGDCFLNAWILDWDWYATFHRPFSLFEANAFYPAHDALAFSENMYGIAVLLFPFRALGVSPLTAHNIAILLGFAFSGFGAYVLGRVAGGSAPAGFVGGVFYAFLPYRFTQSTHVQHVWGGWPPLLLAALLHYARRPSWKRAALFGAAFLMNGLSNIHALFFCTIAVAVTLTFLRPKWRELAVCTLMAAILLAPFLYPYWRVSKMYGMQRGWEETKESSARPGDWLVSNDRNRTYTWLAESRINPECWLFPGVLSLVVALMAVFSRDRTMLGIAASWVTVGFVGSLGLHTFVYRFLFNHVPGFRAMRVPARFAMIAYVGLAMLIALGIAAISGRRTWIPVAVAAAFLMELRAAPVRWHMAVPGTPPVYRWIAANKPRAIIELPMELWRTYDYLLHATAHHVPLVNGISGFSPPQSDKIAASFDQKRISPDALDNLQRIGCELIVVHGDWSAASLRLWLRQQLESRRIHFVVHFDEGVSGAWVFGLGGSAAPPPAIVEAYLNGQPTPHELTFGLLDTPGWNERIIGRNAWFSGFALSPYGVREVNLLFNNGLHREPTFLFPDAALQAYYFDRATARPRFARAFEKRPRSIWRSTDLQVEIVDGRGERTLLPDRFIEWP